MLCFSLLIGNLSHPGWAPLPQLDLRHYLHPGWNPQFNHPPVCPLQVPKERMLQERQVQEEFSGHNLGQNTNERKNKVLNRFDLRLSDATGLVIIYNLSFFVCCAMIRNEKNSSSHWVLTLKGRSHFGVFSVNISEVQKNQTPLVLWHSILSIIVHFFSGLSLEKYNFDWIDKLKVRVDE